MFRNMRLVILFHMFLKPSFKAATRLANVPRTTASTGKFIYYKRFQTIRNWIFIPKIIFNFEGIKLA